MEAGNYKPKIKNSQKELNNRFDLAGEKISKLKDKIGPTRSKEQKEKRKMDRVKGPYHQICQYTHCRNLWKRVKERGEEIEEIMIQNFPNLGKDTHPTA